MAEDHSEMPQQSPEIETDKKVLTPEQLLDHLERTFRDRLKQQGTSLDGMFQLMLNNHPDDPIIKATRLIVSELQQSILGTEAALHQRNEPLPIDNSLGEGNELIDLKRMSPEINNMSLEIANNYRNLENERQIKETAKVAAETTSSKAS
jgi:hypothetical protein